MSIKAYTGIMGSGKTYEVVTVVILSALARGRRVITNIAGINYQVMTDHLVAQGVSAESVGKLVTVEHDDVMRDDFWLTEAGNEAIKSQEIDYNEKRILPGDLVCLDEIWRFWNGFSTKDGDGKKRPDVVMNFMRMHRHFTDSKSGVACDLALITQDVMDISRQVRGVIEESYLMTKLTAIGSSKRYRVDVCARGQTRKAQRQIQRTYNPALFAFYSSHSGRKEGDAAAKEENIDDRGNILKGALFKVILPVGLLVGLFAVWSVVQFFTPEETAAAPVQQEPTATAGPAVQPKTNPEESQEWRVVGWIASNNMRVVISNGDRQRIIEPPTWKQSGLSVETFLPSGEAVTPWGGRTASGMLDKVVSQ